MIKRNKAPIRKAPIKRMHPLPASQSIIKRHSNKIYPVKRQHFLNENPVCQTRIFAERDPNLYADMMKSCEGKAVTVHHTNGREGVNLNDVSTFMSLCAACHQIVDAHREASRLLGYYL